MQVLFEFLVNLQIGTLLSFLLVPLLTLPMLIVHYRRYGRVGRRRAIAFYLLVISITFAIALTLFPLPDPDSLVCVRANVVPFRAVGEMARYADRHGWGLADLVVNRPAFQYLFNIAMLMPLGLLLRRCYRWGWPAILGASAGFSILLELTQATGAWGLYPCAYRVGDVDDVIANTLGGLLGAAISPLAFFLPSDVREVSVPSIATRPSLHARALATGIDVLLAGGIGISAWSLVGYPLVVVVAPVLSHGATPGKWLLRLRIRHAVPGDLAATAQQGRPASPRQLAARALVLFAPWIAGRGRGALEERARRRDGRRSRLARGHAQPRRRAVPHRDPLAVLAAT
ncbi:MAG: VanZ family protein [Chloroflexota bacterium]